MRGLAFTVCVGLLAPGCGGSEGGPGTADAPQGNGIDAGPPADAGPPPTLAQCTGTPFTPVAAGAWNHSVVSAATAALGSPGHSMQDVIAPPGADITIPGKFAYGTVSKDLEDERILVFLDDCDGWRQLGEAVTNSDGRIAYAVEEALPAGVYDVRLEVVGDATLAAGQIWVLPVGSRLVVSDIDGTLTTSDGELVSDVIADFFGPMFTGDYVPVAYPGAADLTHALHDRGHVVVYLTGRPYWLSGITRGWLADGSFAPAPLHTCDSNGEALPTEAGVGAYKLAWLQGLLDAGYVIDEAYGNATTDIYAYLGAGLPPERVWIIGENAGASGTVAVTDTWQPRADEVRGLPPVEQPFEW